MMRKYLAAFLLFGALAAPAAAQPPLDPAALDLARVLMAQDASLYGNADLGSVRGRIEQILLGEPGACNPQLSDCRMAAASAVDRHAAAFLQEERARQERINAYLLADALRPDEMARFAQYLRSTEGQRLVMALGLLRDNDRTGRRRRELEREMARTVPAALAQARAEFRRLSRNIPAPPPR
jgi:hypothetical protein